MCAARYTPEIASRVIAEYERTGSASLAGRIAGVSVETGRRLVREYKAGKDVFANRPNSYGAKKFDMMTGVPPEPDQFGRLIMDDLPDCVLVLPDLQFPYAHPDWQAFLEAVKDKYRPSTIVGIGDEVDSYCLSSYDKDPETMQPSYEYGRALEDLSILYEMFPNVLALHSNHGKGRLEKARIRGGFLRAHVLDYRQFINAPSSWQFYTEIRLGDVIFHHGDGEKKLTRTFLERDVPDQYGRHYSVVHGHRHESAGRQAEISVGDNSYWCAYTGAMINPHAGPFAYTKARKAKLGCGLIIHGEWKRVRLRVNQIGRWTGEI